MSTKKNTPSARVGLNAAAHAELVTAVKTYRKSAYALEAAMESLRAAEAAAAAWQTDLESQRQNVAHVMRRHALTNVRTCGLLLSVDDEGLAAVDDRFTTVAD